MLARAFHAHSAVTRRLLETPAVRYYEASPRLAIASVGLAASQDGKQIVVSRALDLRRNDVRTVGTASGRDLVWANVLRGILDGVVEQTIGGELGTTKVDGSGVSAVSVLERAPSSAPPVALTSLSGWAGTDWPDASKARLAASMKTGAVAIVPARAVDFDGERRAGWWSVHPTTGETLSVMDTGLHGIQEKSGMDAMQYAIFKSTTRGGVALLHLIYSGQVVVRSYEGDLMRTGAFIGAGILAVLAALAVGFGLGERTGEDNERRRREQEDRMRRPPPNQG